MRKIWRNSRGCSGEFKDEKTLENFQGMFWEIQRCFLYLWILFWEIYGYFSRIIHNIVESFVKIVGGEFGEIHDCSVKLSYYIVKIFVIVMVVLVKQSAIL